MEPVHIEGKKRGHVFLFALSTCVWCKRTKRLLNDLSIEYYYIDVDLLEGDEKSSVEGELARWNPRRSFPTIVIDDTRALIGFDEDEIREARGDG